MRVNVIFLTFLTIGINGINGNVDNEYRWELPSEVMDGIGGSFRENGLNYLLGNDDQRCFLKLVCGVGASVTEYGVYADQISKSFGQFDFTVVTNPIHLKILQQKARESSDMENERPLRHSDAIYMRTLASPENEIAWIKIEPSPFVKYARPLTNMVERKPFVFKHSRQPSVITSGGLTKPLVRSVSNGQGLTRPTTYILNRAITIGLSDGPEACEQNFNQCDDRVQEITRFGAKFFSGPNANGIETLK